MEKELPKNWVEAELNQIFSYVIGGDWGKDIFFQDIDYVEALCIRGSEIKNWNRDKGSTATLRKVKKSSLNSRKLEFGDILLEISGGGPEQPVGRTVIVDEEVLSFEKEIEKVCTNFLRLVRVDKKLNSFYVNHYLQYFYHSGEIVKYQGGSNNLRNLKYKEFETIIIPLPPLTEQNRIVAKLDSLFAQLESIKISMAKIPVLLKNFRQQVLTQAVTGKLTEEWRVGKELGNLVEFYKEYSLQRELDFIQLIRDSKENNYNKPRKFANLEYNVILEHDRIFTIKADDWIVKPISWITSSEDSSIVDGPFGSSINVEEDYVEAGVPVIRMINIRPFNFISENLKFLRVEKFNDLKRHNVIQNDILLAKVGATIGDCCLYPEGFEEAILSTTGSCRIRVDKNVMLHSFLVIYLTKNRNILKSIASETAQPFLNMKTIKAFPIAIPTMQEQQEIVSRVESLFAKADAIEEKYKTLKAKIENLPQTILHKAFKGELTEQLETDGDAKVLLEEIVALKNGEKPKKNVSKKYIQPDDEVLRIVAETAAINYPTMVEKTAAYHDQRFELWISQQGLAARGTLDKVTLRELFDAMDDEDK